MTSVYIIAEAGVNHNGSLGLAKDLIDVAAEAGADVIKFQSFKADKLISKHGPKAAYQLKTTDGDESQLAMVRKLELTRDMHAELIEHCEKRGIQFLSTAFDHDSLRLLDEDFKLPLLKIPSGEVTNGPLLLSFARTGRKLLFSTGMATLGEVEEALAVLAYGMTETREPSGKTDFKIAFCSEKGQAALSRNVTILHCVTEYPAPFEDANLRVIETLKRAFGLPVGLSDHTSGIAVSVAAVAVGATVLEKHFTLDRNLPGPDHMASLEPDELADLVRSIRAVEKAMGSPLKLPTPCEVGNREVVRRSLVAIRDISAGEMFSASNLGIKRPGKGLSPMEYWNVIGRVADREYKEDETIVI